jgi:hypothetical protein
MFPNRRRDASRRAGFLLPARDCTPARRDRREDLPSGMDVA